MVILQSYLLFVGESARFNVIVKFSMTELEVIGAGFGRTGTFSLMTALDQLGYKTHHMAAVAELQQAKTWQKIHAGTDVEVCTLLKLPPLS